MDPGAASRPQNGPSGLLYSVPSTTAVLNRPNALTFCGVPNHEVISLLLYPCGFATVRSYNILAFLHHKSLYHVAMFEPQGKSDFTLKNGINLPFVLP